MPELKLDTEVYIYPYGGWHYHMKECWMAVTDMPEKTSNYIAIPFGDIKKARTQTGGKYQPCICVEAYLKGIPMPLNPMHKEGKHNAKS